MKLVSPVTQLTRAPLHSLKSDFDIIKNHIHLPEPSSDSYTHSTHRVIGHKRFNATQHDSSAIDTYELSISGVRLVFEENSELNPLHNAWNGRSDLEQVNLYADEVVIRSPLRLPSSQVSIYARVLVFEGNGCIDITPLSYDTPSSKPEAENGQHAGNIELYVMRIEASGNEIRLIAKGGKGQAAMAGKRGAKGMSVSQHWDGTFNREMFWFDPELKLDWSKNMEALKGHTAIYVEIISTFRRSTWVDGIRNPIRTGEHEETQKIDTWGNADVWPGDGAGPARKPGKPGEPGNGGNILLPATITLDRSSYELKGGNACS
jgi:hypothetical protein